VWRSVFGLLLSKVSRRWLCFGLRRFQWFFGPVRVLRLCAVHRIFLLDRLWRRLLLPALGLCVCLCVSILRSDSQLTLYPLYRGCSLFLEGWLLLFLRLWIRVRLLRVL
jgi:hypothetical protein